jgi:hypothetical protein
MRKWPSSFLRPTASRGTAVPARAAIHHSIGDGTVVAGSTVERTRSEGKMDSLSCDPRCVGTKLSSSKGRAASLDGDHLCRECDGTGWVLYRTETKDGELEEAYRLCPKGHVPRYCMGSSGGPLCPRPATVRCGLGYYCEEHIVGIHDGRDVDGACEEI